MCRGSETPGPDIEPTGLLGLPALVQARIVDLLDSKDKLSLLRCCNSIQDPVLRHLTRLTFHLGVATKHRVPTATHRALSSVGSRLTVSMQSEYGDLQAQAVMALLQALASCPAVIQLILQHCVLPSGPLRELLQAVPTLARIRLHNTTLTSSPSSSRGTPRQQAPLVQGVSEPDHHLVATQAQPKRQLGDSVLDLLSGGLRALELSCHPHPLPLCSGMLSSALTRLCISECHFIGNITALANLGSHVVSGLQELEGSWQTVLTQDLLHPWLPALPHLRVLCLHNAVVEGEAALKVLLACPALERVKIQSIQGLGSPVVTPQGCRLSCLEVEVLDVRSAAHLDPSLLGLISSPFTLQVSASDIPPAAVDRVGGGADGGREERAVRGSDLGLVRAAVTRLCQLPQVAHLCKVHVQPPVAVNRCANAAASSTEAHLCELLRALGPLSSVGVTSQS